ncbi:MAG: cytochrome c [Chloroflexota bacterium]|nr:cytochrome c [Chloroflexota bacterium]
MRLKTLGVVVLLATALFLMFYWLTDSQRLAATTEEQELSQLEYGRALFGEPTAEFASTANCARCHGANGEGGPIPNDPNGRQAPSLHSQRIVDRLAVNPLYVNLVIRYGGVVVSGDVNSPMPAWSQEANGPLTVAQIDALTALVESWAAETQAAAASATEQPVENTAEVGQQVYSEAGCAGCHGPDLAGVEGQFPSLQNIGNEPVTDLPAPVTQLDKLQSDYEADPAQFLHDWIRDSAGNYNDGNPTGMPPFPEDQLSDEQLQALITFLLEQKQ